MPSEYLGALRLDDEELSRLEQLANELTGAVKRIRAESQATKARYSDAPRHHALYAASGIQELLRGPKEYVRAAWLLQMVGAALMVFEDFKGFDHIPAEGAISFADLAKKLDAEEVLIRV